MSPSRASFPILQLPGVGCASSTSGSPSKRARIDDRNACATSWASHEHSAALKQIARSSSIEVQHASMPSHFARASCEQVADQAVLPAAEVSGPLHDNPAASAIDIVPAAGTTNNCSVNSEAQSRTATTLAPKLGSTSAMPLPFARHLHDTDPQCADRETGGSQTCVSTTSLDQTPESLALANQLLPPAWPVTIGDLEASPAPHASSALRPAPSLLRSLPRFSRQLSLPWLVKPAWMRPSAVQPESSTEAHAHAVLDMGNGASTNQRPEKVVHWLGAAASPGADPSNQPSAMPGGVDAQQVCSQGE